MPSRSDASDSCELKSERIDPESHPPARFELADEGRTLTLTHQFGERSTALSFLGIVARLAEHAESCPRIEHVLGQIRISLTTYEEGTVTAPDRLFADLLEATLQFLEKTEKAA